MEFTFKIGFYFLIRENSISFVIIICSQNIVETRFTCMLRAKFSHSLVPIKVIIRFFSLLHYGLNESNRNCETIELYVIKRSVHRKGEINWIIMLYSSENSFAVYFWSLHQS